jgi:SAM-dependent methyltransferase
VRTESVACNLCGSAERQVLSRFEMYAQLALVKCKACGLLYVSPRLTTDSMAFHFNNSYLGRADGLRWERSRRRIYSQVLNLIRLHGKSRIFEIGCSFGTFLSMCASAGLKVGGCDISAEASRHASARVGVDILTGDLARIAEHVPPQECIVSIDTIYYCSDPQDHLALIRSKLTTGGILVLRVRNGFYVEWQTRLRQVSFPVEHLYFFTPRTLGELLTRAGFGRWRIVPGACHGVPGPVDLMMRAASGLVVAGTSNRWLPTRDFCAIAVKEA